MSEIAIKVENISKKYWIGAKSSSSFRETLVNKWGVLTGKIHVEAEEFWALKDVSFEVKQGEILGIIGKNGAGKSTLLKVLSRITEPTSGKAEIYGRVSSLLEVGTGFHPELTGRENIFLNGTILGMSRKEVKIKFDEIVDFSGVEKFIDTPVKHYSSGMYVRLAFAVAAHLEPEILIIDEVLAVGDIEFQKKCLGKMKDVSQNEGRTILFVSHNLSAVINLCNKALLIDKGIIIINSSVNEVIQKYCGNKNHYNGVRTWEDINNAPGSEDVKLHSVTLVSNGSVTDEIDIQDGFLIEIQYWNLKPNLKLYIGLNITDLQENIIITTGNFDSTNNDKDKWFDQPYAVGLFKTTCAIKENLLNVGSYSIMICIHSHVVYHEVFEKEVIPFNIVDRKVYCIEDPREFSGYIRPKLNWQTNKIENVEGINVEK